LKFSEVTHFGPKWDGCKPGSGGTFLFKICYVQKSDVTQSDKTAPTFQRNLLPPRGRNICTEDKEKSLSENLILLPKHTALHLRSQQSS
jgi:hypothetical protein